MNIWSISIQNIKSKPLYTFLSTFSLSLSIGLLIGIQQLKTSFKTQIESNLGEIDIVIGAKGSPLQLVLASVLHLDNPTGNISYNEVERINSHPMVQLAVPISYGDNYKGFRIVETTPEYKTFYNAEMASGRPVEKSMEVVLGSTVAQQLHLKIGDTFYSAHGLIENSIDVHTDELTVVGILKPTQKVIDRLLLTNLESIWDAHNHEVDNHTIHEHNHEHNYEKEITSLLVNLKSPRGLLTFPRIVNKNTNLQAVLPKYELNKLYEYTSVGFKTVSWIAYLILLISGITIFASLYKMVNERAFDLAILRTYGASNFQLIKMVVYEGLIVVFSAFLLGGIFIKIGLYITVSFMQPSSQQSILKEIPFQEMLYIGFLILTMLILAISLAIYQIIKMNISTILSNEK